jgi:chemotaxis protein CheX
VQDIINAAAREAVAEIASTMLFVPINPVPSAANGTAIEADVSAIVALSGGLKGGARLASPVETVTALASALMGEEVSALDADSEDAFAELANMITGGIQTRLSGELGEMNLSPPFVITGKNHRAHGDSSDQVAVSRFEVQGKPFFIEVFYAALER